MITALAFVMTLTVIGLVAFLVRIQGEVDALRREVRRLSLSHPAHPTHTGAMIAPLMFHSRN